MYLASRWTAPTPGNPNYLALKLFTNYDGHHHGFATTSVSDTNNGDPNLFSSYAALDPNGKRLTVLVLNKDPSNAVQAHFTINGFTPSQVTSYTLAVTNPTQIVASNTTAWSSTVTVAPYTATLLVVTGTTQLPGAEWDLNPGHDHGAGGRHRDPSAENHIGHGHSNLGHSDVRQRYHRSLCRNPLSAKATVEGSL